MRHHHVSKHLRVIWRPKLKQRVDTVIRADAQGAPRGGVDIEGRSHNLADRNEVRAGLEDVGEALSRLFECLSLFVLCLSYPSCLRLDLSVVIERVDGMV